MFRYLLEGADDYFEHIGKYKKAYKRGQKNNQYLISIAMEKPIKKNTLDSVFFKSVSITFEGFENEPVELGNGKINSFAGITPMKIDVVMHEMFDYEVNGNFVDRDLYSYFFMKNRKEFIIPNDGTFLLPYEYYFHIKIYSLSNSTGMLQGDRVGKSSNKYLAKAQEFLGAGSNKLLHKPILEGEFNLEGQTQLNWVNANNGENQELVLSFVPISSNQIKRFKQLGDTL